MSELLFLIPVTVFCWTIAAIMFWKFDIGGYRSEHERNKLSQHWKNQADAARRKMNLIVKLINPASKDRPFVLAFWLAALGCLLSTLYSGFLFLAI